MKLFDKTTFQTSSTHVKLDHLSYYSGGSRKDGGGTRKDREFVGSATVRADIFLLVHVWSAILSAYFTGSIGQDYKVY